MTIGREFLKEVEGEFKASRRLLAVPIPQLYRPTADEK
jgi:hypothetical protein